jgi:hypothetical protein
MKGEAGQGAITEGTKGQAIGEADLKAIIPTGANIPRGAKGDMGGRMGREGSTMAVTALRTVSTAGRTGGQATTNRNFAKSLLTAKFHQITMLTHA